MTKNAKLNNLQSLRAVACLSVVLFHLAGALGGSGYQNFANDFFLKIGASGVDIFFVISGFVMVYIQMNQKTKPLRFLQNRILRIAPLYWVLTLTMALVLLIAPGAFRTNQFGIDRFISSMMFSCGLALRKETLIFPGWTIEFEFFFYLVFFFSLFFRKILWSIGTATAVLSACVAFGYIDSIALEFVFGMVVAAVYCSRTFPNSIYLVAASFGSIWLVLTGVIEYGSIDRVLIWGAPSAFIVFGAAGLRQSGRNFMTVLGDSSYSIYLAQAFLIPSFLKLSNRAWVGAPYEVLIVSGFTFVTVFGFLCYQLLEMRLALFATKAIGRSAAIA